MRISRGIRILGQSYGLIWEEGFVSLADMNIEDEFIAYTLSNIPAEYTLFVVEELIKELSGLSKEDFCDYLAQRKKFFSLSLEQLLRLDLKKELVNSEKIYLLRVTGPDVFPEDEIWSVRVQNWFVDARVLGGNARAVMFAMAVRVLTSPKVLDKMARLLRDQEITWYIANNPSTSNQTLLHILSNQSEKDSIYIAAIKNWHGEMPKSLIDTLQKYCLLAIDIALAGKNIDEDLQLYYAEDPSLEVREALRANLALTPRARARLEVFEEVGH